MHWSEYVQIFVVLIISITLYAARAIPIVTRLAQLLTFPALVFLFLIVVYVPTDLLLLPVARLLPRSLAVFLNTIAPISCAIVCAWLYARAVGLFDLSRWSSEFRLWVAVFLSGIGHLVPIHAIIHAFREVSSAGRPNRAPAFIWMIFWYGLSFLLTVRLRREPVDAKQVH